MFAEVKRILQTDKQIKWVWIAGLVVQLISCITAIGVSSADQHFQIVEFSLHQLGKESGAPFVWEMLHFVRPTLQVYLFSGYHQACNFLGITDPYSQLTILRILLGLVMFAVFNLVAVFYFKNGSRKILLYVLLLLNFSWCLPYTRTLYSSETVCSLVFFGTLLLYEIKKEKQPGFIFLAIIGLLFSMAFYFRFQMAMAMVGFGIYVLSEKRYKYILPIAAGFVIGILINVYLDFLFYKEWVFTPFTYFYANINDGRAAQFGESSFLRYIGLLILVAPAPFFSIVFLYYGVKALFKNFSNPLLLSVIIFIVGHSLIGHKEERFLFPIFNVLPMVIGFGIPELELFYANGKKWVRSLMKGFFWFTVGLNMILLIAILSVPYSQTIKFSYLLKERFDGKPVTLHCLGQTPFETPSKNPMVFYKNGAKNITLKRVGGIDSLRLLNEKVTYLAATYNDIKNNKPLLDSLGYHPVMYSSSLLWKINGLLQSKKINTINEIWALYIKE